MEIAEALAAECGVAAGEQAVRTIGCRKDASGSFQNGELVGAIGGSGGTAQQDEDCAKVGLAAL